MNVLRRQRSGVAGDDLAVVDDSVFAAQRILLTLAEARRRRHSLLSLLVGREHVGLGELGDALGPLMTPELAQAQTELQAGARVLADELERNRRILNGAISSGDRLIRALTGAPAEPNVYGTTANPRGASGGAPLIDRQV